MNHWTPASFICALLLATAVVSAQDPLARVEQETTKVTPAMVEIRHRIHQNPELSNREEKTAALIADYLRKLGLEVQTGVAKHGVVALLKGGRPGPVVAVRADIDALPVTEETNLPFASKVRTTYLGQDVGVMHACGHDIHTAVQLGVATVLTADESRACRGPSSSSSSPPKRARLRARGWRVADGEGRRAAEPAPAGDLWPARVLGDGGRRYRLFGRPGPLGRGHLGSEDRRTPGARRPAGAVNRSDRHRRAIHRGAADNPIAHVLRTRARSGHDRNDSRRPAPQHHSCRRHADRNHPDVPLRR